MKYCSIKLHQPDYRFIIALALIIVFGLIMLSSASVSLSYDKFGEGYYYVKHQILNGLIPGIILLIIFSFIDYRFWKKIALGLLIFSIILLVLVFVPGIGAGYGSANSWLNILGFSFQPSELVKLTFLIYLATWLESRGQKKASDFSEGLVPFLSILGIIAVLLILQPDIGTMSIIILTSLAVYFIGGANLIHMLGVGLAGFLSLVVLIKISPYRAARLMTFLHPELDPQGIGYHINQAFLAIGSGGFWGRGFGMSRQKFQYLPEVAGDSIFAIIAEELGFFLATILILGFLYLMYRGFKIAQNAPDSFSKILVIGIVSWIMIQAFVNIGAMVGLLPLTGVPLPFISYGGTAMAVLLAACGIVINISRKTCV
ncbi:MAG: putative lipid II flippase FtsW [Candidatus Buchananbacteria bacterium]|nr:putative lipid II flippase FtsW [Candidatus Buchananbacteria bacterium]